MKGAKTMNGALLEKARLEAARYAEAERQAQVARGEFYSAVRTLHLGGAALREIAQALGVSHQRVQQMVHAAGGSWWQRLRGRRIDPVAICSFCERPPSAVAKLVAGPGVYICDACIARAERVAGGRSDPAGTLHGDSSRRARCSFCRVRASKTSTVVAGAAAICVSCLRECRRITEDAAR